MRRKMREGHAHKNEEERGERGERYRFINCIL